MCFWAVVLVLCFLVGFCLCFCFFFWRLAPETVWKNSIDVRSGFFLGSFSLFSLGFSPTSFLFFLRDKAQVVTGHPLTLTCFAGFFSFFVSRRLCLFRPFWPCVPLLGGFLGAPRVFVILLGPSEAFFLGREVARVFVCFSCLVFFFPLFFAATLFLDSRG